MKRFSMMTCCFAAAALAVGATTAQDDKVDRRVEAISSLTTAAQLIAFGRGELGDVTGLKGVKSPEALVSAAGILLRVHAASEGKLEALDNDKAGKVPNLKEEAEALIIEAEGLVAGKKDRAKAIKAMVEQATKFETRGAIGHPRAQTRTLSPGQSWNVKVGFEPHAPAYVGFRSSGTSRLRFEVMGEGGGNMFSIVGAWGEYSWNTARDRDDGRRKVGIRITNVGRNAAAVTFTTN